MNVTVFNACLLIGWLLVLIGGVIISLGWGLLAAGALLIVLTMAAARAFGLVAAKGEA